MQGPNEVIKQEFHETKPLMIVKFSHADLVLEILLMHLTIHGRNLLSNFSLF